MDSRILNKYENDFLDNFNIVYDIKELSKEKDYNILIDIDYKYTDKITNQDVYIIHSILELENVLDFFYDNIEFLEDYNV